MKTLLIFISGIPGTGKTTLANKLALNLKTDRVISLDNFKLIIKRFIKQEEEPYLFTTTHEAYTLENLSIIDGFIKHSEVLMKYLLKYIEDFNKEKIVIIEGASLTPEIINFIDKDKFDIKYFNIYLFNKKKLFERYDEKEKQRKSNWKENIENILEIQNHLLTYKDIFQYSGLEENLIDLILEDIFY